MKYNFAQTLRLDWRALAFLFFYISLDMPFGRSVVCNSCALL